MKLEESLLGHLIDSENIKRSYELGLQSIHFEEYVSINRNVFEFIKNYWMNSGRQTAPTIEVIKHSFPSYEHIEPEETLDWLVFEIKKRYKFNRIAESVQKTAELADGGDIDEALREMASSSFSILQDTANRTSSSNFVNNAQDRMTRYIERATFDGEIKGAPLGLPEIDQHLFGIFPGELCVIGGYAGTGKTFSAVNAALAGLKSGFNVYLSTLEVARQDIEDRMDAMGSGVDYSRLTRGKLDREELEKLEAWHNQVPEIGSQLIIDEADRNERTVQALVNKALQSGSNYLIIDQLSFLQGRKQYYKTTQDKIAEILQDLHESIADTGEHKLSCLILVQFNREQKKSGKAELFSFADAAAVERFADIAFGLNQTGEMRVMNAMEFPLLKFRRGPIKKWMLNWKLSETINISVDSEIEDD